MDPIDVLGVHPSGANVKRADTRDYKYGSPELGFAAIPFDWSKGYDVEEDIAQTIGASFQMPTKNQGAAGSCGGEAISAYGQAITAFYLKEASEKSAKAPYAQVYVPGGGSDDRELANIYIKQGIYKESLVPSYPSPGVAPTEAFMERSQDITPTARLDAAKESAMLAYSFPVIDIDILAEIIRDCKGVMIGLYGTNNGTWLSAEPLPPTPAEIEAMSVWSHYMYFGKAFEEGGVKKIWGKQSWGPNVGVNGTGWQKIDQTYFNSGALWSAMALVVSAAPVNPPSHSFTMDLKLGMNNSDVRALQQLLCYDGDLNVAPTGFYGPITAQAVLRFQIKYDLASKASLDELGGDLVGPATRAKLSQLM